MVTVNLDEFNNVFIITIAGDFIFNYTKDAELLFDNVIKNSPEAIGVNCKNLTTLDSSGLGIFIKFLRTAEEYGFALHFIDISDQVSALFDLSKLSYMFDVMSRDEFNDLYL